MTQTGPPWFAADDAEAARAQAYQVSQANRRAFAAALQARLVAPAGRAIQTLYNWQPLRKDQ